MIRLETTPHRWTRITVAAALVLPFLWLFWPAVFCGQGFVYRDAAHYYYPLVEYTTAQWGAGRIPLWNPHDNLGQPLLADPTSSVFYPGKLIFTLPLEFALRYKLYILVHIVIAAVGSYRCAREWGSSRHAAGLCAVAYTFGGNVFFQYCNVVFLIGAAWLPFALLITRRMLTERRIRWALVLGLVLALMILGGDPQAAYHACLMAGMYALMVWRAERMAQNQATGNASADPLRIWWPQKLVMSRPFLLAAAAATGVLLAAVQVFPSIAWARHSSRAAHNQPRSIYELPEFFVSQARIEQAAAGADMTGGLLAKTSPGTHHAHMYQFSVGPWRLAELIWPNFGGRNFPVHQRWMDAIPAEGAIWTPSLYMGLLPIILAGMSWSLRGPCVHIRFLSWTVLLSVLGSFGWYGVGWLVYEAVAATTGDSTVQLPVGEPFGGIYWLMNVLLPGYTYFRYPAKLFVPAALAISFLAARGWDRAFDSRSRPGSAKLCYVLFAFAGISLLAAVMMALGTAAWLEKWLDGRVDAAPLFGPFDSAGAVQALSGSFLHTTVLCFLFGWLASGFSGPGRKFRTRWVVCSLPQFLVLGAALVLTGVELALAQRWMVPYAPESSWNGPSQVAGEMAEHDAASSHRGKYRLYRSLPLLPEWRRKSSIDRQRVGMRWDRDTLLSRYHLQFRASQIEVSAAMIHHRYQTFLRMARRYGMREAVGGGLPQDVLDALAVKYLILPDQVQVEGFQRLEPKQPRDGIANVDLWYNPTFSGRAWIVPIEHVKSRPPEASDHTMKLEGVMAEVFGNRESPRRFRQTALIETDNPFDRDHPSLRSDSTDIPVNPFGGECRIVVDEPERVEILAELARPGLVVLCDQFDSGWQLNVTSGRDGQARRRNVYLTNGVMRGTVLPAGKHRLVYTYRPLSFVVGAVLSGCAWLLGAGLWICRSVGF